MYKVSKFLRQSDVVVGKSVLKKDEYGETHHNCVVHAVHVFNAASTRGSFAMVFFSASCPTRGTVASPSLVDAPWPPLCCWQRVLPFAATPSAALQTLSIWQIFSYLNHCMRWFFDLLWYLPTPSLPRFIQRASFPLALPWTANGAARASSTSGFQTFLSAKMWTVQQQMLVCQLACHMVMLHTSVWQNRFPTPDRHTGCAGPAMHAEMSISPPCDDCLATIEKQCLFSQTCGCAKLCHEALSKFWHVSSTALHRLGNPARMARLLQFVMWLMRVSQHRHLGLSIHLRGVVHSTRHPRLLRSIQDPQPSHGRACRQISRLMPWSSTSGCRIMMGSKNYRPNVSNILPTHASLRTAFPRRLVEQFEKHLQAFLGCRNNQVISNRGFGVATRLWLSVKQCWAWFRNCHAVGFCWQRGRVAQIKVTLQKWTTTKRTRSTRTTTIETKSLVARWFRFTPKWTCCWLREKLSRQTASHKSRELHRRLPTTTRQYPRFTKKNGSTTPKNKSSYTLLKTCTVFQTGAAYSVTPSCSDPSWSPSPLFRTDQQVCGVSAFVWSVENINVHIKNIRVESKTTINETTKKNVNIRSNTLPQTGAWLHPLESLPRKILHK